MATTWPHGAPASELAERVWWAGWGQKCWAWECGAPPVVVGARQGLSTALDPYPNPADESRVSGRGKGPSNALQRRQARPDGFAIDDTSSSIPPATDASMVQTRLDIHYHQGLLHQLHLGASSGRLETSLRLKSFPWESRKHRCQLGPESWALWGISLGPEFKQVGREPLRVWPPPQSSKGGQPRPEGTQRPGRLPRARCQPVSSRPRVCADVIS